MGECRKGIRQVRQNKQAWKMDLSLERRRRLLELVGEAREILGGCLDQDGRPKTFAELEDECIEVGDLFTVELLRERIAERKPDAIGRYCPICGCEGERNPDGGREEKVTATNGTAAYAVRT